MIIGLCLLISSLRHDMAHNRTSATVSPDGDHRLHRSPSPCPRSWHERRLPLRPGRRSSSPRQHHISTGDGSAGQDSPKVDPRVFNRTSPPRRGHGLRHRGILSVHLSEIIHSAGTARPRSCPIVLLSHNVASLLDGLGSGRLSAPVAVGVPAMIVFTGAASTRLRAAWTARSS